MAAISRTLLKAIESRLRNGATAGVSMSHGRAREAARRAGILDDDEFEKRYQRRAAIFVPLLNVNGATSLLYTQRSHNVGTHKGQVSFPGGHVDAGESIELAAVRELCEELLHGQTKLQESLISAARLDDGTRHFSGDGGDASSQLQVEILGTGPVVRAVTGTLCTCVLGYLSGPIVDQGLWTRSPDEVEAIFTAPVSTLQEVVDFEDLGGSGRRVAVYRHDTFPARIWGLTAHLTDSIIKTVLEPAIAEANNPHVGNGKDDDDHDDDDAAGSCNSRL